MNKLTSICDEESSSESNNSENEQGHHVPVNSKSEKRPPQRVIFCNSICTLL